MSQNRQEAKDRTRAWHDYKVNLKAGLEIRHLQEKMDHLFSKQWERLVQIQDIQLERLKEKPQYLEGPPHVEGIRRPSNRFFRTLPLISSPVNKGFSKNSVPFHRPVRLLLTFCIESRSPGR
jgi:hypothetical protein